ncbi:MAG: hypothetical protein RL379_659 [Bacillota bacterium]|jgi:nitrite reductase/ring-hydroxylating ferredoxin subunit
MAYANTEHPLSPIMDVFYLTTLGNFTYGKSMQYKLGSFAKLKQDKKWRVILSDHPYLIALVGNHVYAIPDQCPHQEASLFQGKLEGEIITCPLHQAKFNLVSGEIDEVSKMIYFDFGPEKITTHKVVIDGDQLILDV